MKAIVNTTRRLAQVIGMLALAVGLSLLTAGLAFAHPVTSAGSYGEAPAQSNALLIGIVLAAAAAVACALVVFGLRHRRRTQRAAAASPIAGPSVVREHRKAA